MGSPRPRAVVILAACLARGRVLGALADRFAVHAAAPAAVLRR